MVTLIKPLLSLTAADLMSTDLLLIPREMSLQGAARLLSRHQVTGAPVVDDQGRCIGVISATDFMHWVEKGERAVRVPCGVPCYCSSWQMEVVDILPEDAVARFMTANPVIVSKNRPIGELAKIMLDAHIHRVIVVDEQSRPVGVVTSTDMLAAIAYAEPCEKRGRDL